MTEMSELMFECYGAPAVAYGVDAMFSFHHASRAQKLNGVHWLLYILYSRLVVIVKVVTIK
jgi:actin-related protein 5